MTIQDKIKVKRAKKNMKHQQEKDLIIRRFIDSKIPEWGSLKIKLI